MMTKLVFILTLCFTLAANAGLLFSYSRLATKDLDQMNQLVVGKIKEAKAEHGDKTIPLKEALQAVFSRPNEDFMIEKVLPPLKNELEDLNAWERSIKSLVKEASGALSNAKAFKPEAQVTYSIFLENLVTELKPNVKFEFERSVLTQISKAKIELTKDAISERRLRMMKDGASPSALAQAVLDDYEKAKKEEAANPAAANEKPDNMGDKKSAEKSPDSK